MLKPFKFVVQTVLLEVDEEGNPIGERASEQPAVLYGADQLRDFANTVVIKVDEANAETSVEANEEDK